MPEVRAWRSHGDGMVALVAGAGGGIGAALGAQILERYRLRRLFVVSRGEPPASPADARVVPLRADLLEDGATAQLARAVAGLEPRLDLLFNCCGLLHDGALKPEKSVAAIDAGALARLFAVNATLPALLARDLGPLLRRSPDAVFASLSARVGSIADNRAGGWYGYRASKAAQNMLLRTLALEWRHAQPRTVCVMLQPGTVVTPLSQPFLNARSREHAMTPAVAAAHLLDVVERVEPAHSGSFLDWQGQVVPW
ncbi:MAG: SDR family NAD(P)-dependent oxidoreductase [Pseudomonadales bacterium]|nr:SDR family NAD(P)-dependent oxidoreductase [Pseudomonadales bacterium]